MTDVRTYRVPGLAEVTLDHTDPNNTTLLIRLDPAYRGDLNDIALATAGPADVYLECDENTALNNPTLMRFMEVLVHWDSTGDRVPDHHELVTIIEESLRKSTETPKAFRRMSGGWFVTLVNKLMPPAPQWHLVMSFGQLKPRFRLRHHLGAIPMLVLTLGLIQLQIHLLPWTGYSVIGGLTAAFMALGLNSLMATACMVVIIVGGVILSSKRKQKGSWTASPYTYGLMNQSVVFEEQDFREGSEDWSLWQRVRSCVAFGLVHLINLFYPLATIIPLALAGGIFMAIYLHTYRKTGFRRAAVLNAAIWHRVYNRMALVAVAVSLLGLVGYSLFGFLAVGGILTTLVVTTVLRHKQRQRAAKAAAAANQSTTRDAVLSTSEE